jgi:hypothetical protein
VSNKITVSELIEKAIKLFGKRYALPFHVERRQKFELGQVSKVKLRLYSGSIDMLESGEFEESTGMPDGIECRVEYGEFLFHNARGAPGYFCLMDINANVCPKCGNFMKWIRSGDRDDNFVGYSCTCGHDIEFKYAELSRKTIK